MGRSRRLRVPEAFLSPEPFVAISLIRQFEVAADSNNTDTIKHFPRFRIGSISGDPLSAWNKAIGPSAYPDVFPLGRPRQAENPELSAKGFLAKTVSTRVLISRLECGMRATLAFISFPSLSCPIFISTV